MRRLYLAASSNSSASVLAKAMRSAESCIRGSWLAVSCEMARLLLVASAGSACGAGVYLVADVCSSQLVAAISLWRLAVAKGNDDREVVSAQTPHEGLRAWKAESRALEALFMTESWLQ